MPQLPERDAHLSRIRTPFASAARVSGAGRLQASVMQARESFVAPSMLLPDRWIG